MIPSLSSAVLVNCPLPPLVASRERIKVVDMELETFSFPMASGNWISSVWTAVYCGA